MVADVLVEIKAKQIDQTFTYSIPDELINDVAIGKRVIVPFGGQTLEGFVLKLENRIEEFKLKEIIEIVDDEAILNDELMELGKYISKKTLTNLITSYQTMLPSALKAKHGFNVSMKYQKYIRLIDKNYYPKNEKQKEMMDMLSTNDVLKKELQSISVSILQTLIKNKVVEEYQEEEYRLNKVEELVSSKIKLTEEQQVAISSVEAYFNKFKPFLLHGVTGSGKTEVYIRLIEKVLIDKKEAIVLVPEISLTPQLVDIFHKRFGNKIAILHSRLSDGEKYDEWRKIKRKEVQIVIGARSAIFAPLTNIGLIIVDEEHTTTYKQENNPKYNAVDIALTRAKYHMCPIILGSATPSIESYTRATMGIYELLNMKKRISNMLPKVELVDMKDSLKSGHRIISKKLQEALEECFSKKEQAILLLNRRGYATTVTCHECGHKVICPNCDLPLTYHKKSNSMKCHYCNHITFKPTVCPECGSKEINQFGLGTEKLEEELSKMFPTIDIVRMDIDTTSKKGSHDQIIKSFANKEYQLLIGTQMIAKGLDFEDVTLVGVINGDASLNIPDFRSAERTYSLLNQVAGRAGRAAKMGKVIIQGFNLNHYSIINASTHNYVEFYKEEMEVRKILKYPPYYNLSIIKIVGKDYDKCLEESDKIYSFLSNKLSKNVFILGPSSDILPKVNNKFYIQITLKYKSTSEIIQVFKFLQEKYRKNSTVSVDFDLAA
jgi:primosomal protein N''